MQVITARRSTARKASVAAAGILRRAFERGVDIGVFRDSEGIVLADVGSKAFDRRNPEHLIGVYSFSCPQEWIEDDLIRYGLASA